MQSIIRVENLGKQYRIGNRPPYLTVRESLMNVARKPFSFLLKSNEAEKHIWALKDISFSVEPGEVLGLIGRNGAGKSTLLKVLSRITEPTKGKAELYGRVASLLEVGTGFHPELTGRENIFLSGAVLGMTRFEIKKHFDEIVDFAEIEKFIDTPVKLYSSGMYTRLAFAVAAYMQSEILLIDEVLAVGDAEFQKKCLGKMADIGSRGRTVIFVSHSMPMVLRLCQRVILLSQGEIVTDGTPQEVTRKYLSSNVGSPAQRVWEEKDAPGDETARLLSIKVLNDENEVADSIDIRKPITVEVEYFNLKEDSRVTAILHFVNEAGITLFCSNDFTNKNWLKAKREAGKVVANCRIPGNFLAEGQVFVLVALGTYNPNIVHCVEHDAVSFQVVDRSEGDGVRGECTLEWAGVVRPMLKWDVETDKVKFPDE